MVPEGEPLVMFLRALVSQGVGYFSVVGLIYLVVWRWGRQRFRGARIPQKSRVDTAQLRREWSYTLATLAVGSATAVLISWLYASGRTQLTVEAGVWHTVGAIAALLLINDVWFYACHRLLHHPRLYRHVHVVHHRSVDVNPFSSYAFHPLEGLLLGAWLLPCVLLVPIPLPALGVVQAVGLANNVVSHLGYEFFPRALLRVPLLRWINTATFHSLHHTTLRGNYGLMLRVWDRWLGTEVPHYEDQFVTRGER